MKKTSLLALAAMACFAMASAAVAWARPAVELVVNTYRAAKKLVLDGFKLAANGGDGLFRPAVLLVQAKAFVARLAKRERPEVTGSWRMCPST